VFPPELTAVKTVPVVTVLAQLNPDEVTAHSPFEDLSVKPEPEVVVVKVAHVCVLHVP